MNSLFNRHCNNIGGKVRINKQFSGVLGDIISQVPQVRNLIENTIVKLTMLERFSIKLTVVQPRTRMRPGSNTSQKKFVPCIRAS